MKRTLTPPALLVILFALLSTVYSVVVPPFETPDEIWHMAFVQYVAEGKGLPIATPNTQELWRQQGTQAPLYYLGAAALTFWIDQSDFPALYARSNPHARIGVPEAETNRNYQVHYAGEGWRGSLLALHIARLWSVALGALTVWSTYRLLALLFSPWLALLGAAAVAFLPQYVFLSGAVSNDNATTAFAALTLWRLAVLLKPRELAAPVPLREFIFLGACTGLALGSKLSAGPLALPVALGIAVVAWRAKSPRLFVTGALAAALPALLIGGWWFIRNWVLYRDLLAWNMWQANILRRLAAAGWPTIASELVSLERSFWGLFGWLNAPYPEWVYAVFRAGEIVILLGLVLGVVQAVRRIAVGWLRPDWRWLVGGAALLWLSLLTVSWLRFMREVPAAQGRYFFPALPAFALLVALALWGWLQVAGRVGRRLLAVPTIALALLATVTPFWVIAPAYATPPSREDLRAELTPVLASVGEAFRITGVSGETGELQPGDEARVVVAWENVAATDADYSVFVHLVSDAGLIIAQLDTMPGGGNHPTSQWRLGETRVEEYYVRIPKTAYAPDRGRWAVGMYHAATGERASMMLDSSRAATTVAENALHFGAARITRLPGEVPNAVNIGMADNVTFEGYEFSRRLLRPGDALAVTLYWRPRGPISRSYVAFAHLLDSDFNTRGGQDLIPEPPLDAWEAGKLYVTEHRFAVTAEATPGIHQVEIGLYTIPEVRRLTLLAAPGAEGADRVLLGPLRVTAP